MKNQGFVKYCALAGGNMEAAKELGLSIHTVMAYRSGARNVRPRVAKEIETLTNGEIKRHVLLWPKEYAA